MPPTDIVKQQVAAHWGRRAAHFDEDFGHSIRTPGRACRVGPRLRPGARRPRGARRARYRLRHRVSEPRTGGARPPGHRHRLRPGDAGAGAATRRRAPAPTFTSRRPTPRTCRSPPRSFDLVDHPPRAVDPAAPRGGDRRMDARAAAGRPAGGDRRAFAGQAGRGTGRRARAAAPNTRRSATGCRS